MLSTQTVSPHQQHFSLQKITPPSETSSLLSNFTTPHNLLSFPLNNTPRFNLDHLYFTPAFIPPQDLRFYRENINFEKLKFEERVQNAQQKNIIQDNYNFRPPLLHCQLCHHDFHDYEEHTHSHQHRNNLTNSPINHFIQELTEKFEGIGEYPIKRGKFIRKCKTGKQKNCSSIKCNQLGIALQSSCSKTSSQSTNNSGLL